MRSARGRRIIIHCVELPICASLCIDISAVSVSAQETLNINELEY